MSTHTVADLVQTLAAAWGAQVAYPRRTLHELFEAQAERTPTRTAVVFGKETLTYADLDARANRLAHLLRVRGVTLETRVGVCLERGPEILVALLAILKAGGAYVPLDPAHPAARRLFQLQDTEAAVLITRQPFALDWGNYTGKIVWADNLAAEMERASAERLRCETNTSSLAYIIYTSGSTGKPKGVCVQHGALVNALLSRGDAIGFTRDDVMLARTPLSFDIAALELFLPLLMGAQLVMAKTTEASDGQQLARLMREHGVTAMQGTPSAWRLLAAAGWRGEKRFKAGVGGEVLDAALANVLRERGAAVWNVYGPSEATIWCCLYRVAETRDPLPIGKPGANVVLYLLDERMQPVPQGTVGEIYIGGAGVAREYWKRPELTREKFITNPFVTIPFGDAAAPRLFKTGDRARFLADGNLEFVGRTDAQVKLRGMRIELGEIEACLREQPNVEQAVVLLREADTPTAHLVAYVTPRPGEKIVSPAVEKFLRARLPAAMIPAAVVALERLPLSVNGKVDRAALPAPDPADFLNRAFVAPRTALEIELAVIWQEVLRREAIGAHDDFFALGGHSLLAAQVVSRIRDQMRREIPLQTLFDAPNIAALAQRLDETPTLGAHAPAAISPRPR